MRTLLFVILAVVSFSILLIEDVVAQQRGGWDLPAIPTPGKRASAQPKTEQPKPPKTEKSEQSSADEECDRKKNNSLACRRDVFRGRQSRLVNFHSEEDRLFGTWTVRTLVTMTTDSQPKEVEIDPGEVPIRGLTWSAMAVSAISDIPRGHREFARRRSYQIRDDGVTVDLYLTGQNVPELAFTCRMAQFSRSGDNLVCIYHEAPAGELNSDTKYVAKGYITFTRKAQPRRQPEITSDPYSRQAPRNYEYRRRTVWDN